MKDETICRWLALYCFVMTGWALASCDVRLLFALAFWKIGAYMRDMHNEIIAAKRQQTPKANQVPP